MKIDITLPTDLNEIPLLRYQKFIEMQQKSNDEEFIAQKNDTDILWHRIKGSVAY